MTHPSEIYAGDDRAAREAAAGAADGGGFLGGWHRAVAGVRADQAADVFAEGQARRLEMGGRARGGPELPGTYYLGYEHSELKRMVETNMDPGQVNETGAGWNSLGNALVEFQGAVAAAVGRSGEDWSGAAGNAARDYLSGLGEWMGDTGQASQLAANRMNAQAEAAGAARAGMPEPVEFSMSDAIGMLARETNPLALRDAIAQVNARFEQKQQAHERAAEVMTTFAGAMGDSGAGMPEFAAVPAMGSATGGVGGPGPSSRGPNVEWPGRGGSRPLGGGGPSDSSDPGIPEWGGRPAGSERPVDDETRAPDSDPGSTPAQGWGPVAGERAVADGSGMRTVGLSPGSMTVGAVPVGGSSPDGVWGFGPGGQGSESGQGGRNGDARERGGGRGAAGLEPAGAGERGGGRGAGGGGSKAGFDPMGAGERWRAEEDREHRRPSWLEEPDPEAVFGTDEPTVPPVIGLDAG